MIQFTRYFLPLFFFVYVGVAFVWASVRVAKRIGKSPLVLPKDDSAYGLIGTYFKLTMIALGVYAGWYTFDPSIHERLAPISLFQYSPFTWIALSILVASLIWTAIAQIHMHDAWRIGIDEDTPTDLVISGLFRFSRNPIFLGMIGSLSGLFLLTPNACTLSLGLIGFMLIQIQIRLEEDFLTRQHGQKYLDYLVKTPRFL